MSTFLSIHGPALVIGLPLLAAFLVPLVSRYLGGAVRSAWVFIFMTLTCLVGLLLAAHVFEHGTLVYVFGAGSAGQVLPDGQLFPVRITFTIDAMSAVMTVIASVVAFCITIYSLISEKESSGLDGFYALLFLLVAGVMGMVNTGDLFNFFVFLEISSLAAAALVAFRIDKGVAVEAGFKYAFLSTLGAMSFLIGVGLLYAQYDALNMAELARRIQFTDLDKIALALMIVPLLMKCGAVPMHFWTPDSYSAAPSSITALLVVTSQASLYGVFRICFSVFGTAMNCLTFGWIIIIMGVLSMFIGVTMALPQKDVKRLMAYHAVSQTGYMLLGIGVGLAVLGDRQALSSFGFTALTGGIFHIMNHALYKGLLFLTAGAVFYRIGTRNLNKMGGLAHSMKGTMICFIIGALAIAGIPPFNGFASKIMIYESVFVFNPFLAIIAMLVSILTLASFVKVFHSMFMGPRQPSLGETREVPLPMMAGMVILAVLVVLFGLIPTSVVNGMIAPAAEALVSKMQYVSSVVGGL